MNGWVKVGADNTVTVMMAKSEMGQGAHTGLAAILAEELDADWAQVRLEMTPIDDIYNNLATVVDGLPFHPDNDGSMKAVAGWLTAKTMREVGVMMTGGSSSIKDLWLPMREAGAHARAMLIRAAAAQWGVQASECTANAGWVEHAAGQRATFGDLAALAAQQPMPGKVTLKEPAQFKLIGKPLTRIEAPSKLDGTAVFGIDANPPGLLHASLVMCPTRGGKVARFDAAAAQKLPGVKHVLEVAPYHGGTGGVAVIADTPWHAKKAAAAVTVEWDHGPASRFVERHSDGAAGSRPWTKQRALATTALAMWTWRCRARPTPSLPTTARPTWRTPRWSPSTARCSSRTVPPPCGHPPRCRAWPAGLRPRRWTSTMKK